MTPDEPPPPAAVILAGVPVPVTVYGFNAQGKGVAQHRPVRGELQFTGPLPTPSRHLPLQIGVGAALSTVLGDSDGDLEVKTRFTTIDTELLMGPFLPFIDDAASGTGLTVGVGPAILFEHVYVDENLRLDTWSYGLRVRGRFTVGLGGPVLAALDAGWERYGPPRDRDDYFNHPLDRTVLMSLCAGLVIQSR